MTKAELIEKVASAADIRKTEAQKVLEGFIESVKGALKKGQKVTLVGFGTFSVSKRKARKGKNPRTGEAIKIPAAKVPRFSPGKTLKDAIKK